MPSARPLAGTPPPTNAAIEPNSLLLYAGSLCHKLRGACCKLRLDLGRARRAKLGTPRPISRPACLLPCKAIGALCYQCCSHFYAQAPLCSRVLVARYNRTPSPGTLPALSARCALPVQEHYTLILCCSIWNPPGTVIA
jgi:hypothetical protein